MTKGLVKGSACDVCGCELGNRNRFGRCIRCRTAEFKSGIHYDHEPDPETMKRILYYRQRAALGLDLFDGSPWARLPGGHQRALERQTKLAIATGRVAPAGKVDKSPE